MLPPATFVFAVTGIYTCFLTWGILQERVSTSKYEPDGAKFTYFLFLNAVQSLFAAVLAYGYLRYHLQSIALTARLGWSYLQVAVTNAVASPFGYASLAHIDYPTLVLGKSCKLVPVVAMNWVLYRKKFPWYKYVSVALITLGVSGFMLAQPKKIKPGEVASSSVWGLLLLGINLALDGATNSTQDRIFHQFRVSGQHMMMYMNLLSAFGTLVYFLIWPGQDELARAMAFCVEHPRAIMDISLFSLLGALGQLFIFYTLEKFGSVSLVTVTVTRKLFTILLSVFWFGHLLLPSQYLFVGVVFVGIGMDAYMKTMEKKMKQTGKVAKHHEEEVKVKADSETSGLDDVDMAMGVGGTGVRMRKTKRRKGRGNKGVNGHVAAQGERSS